MASAGVEARWPACPGAPGIESVLQVDFASAVIHLGFGALSYSCLAVKKADCVLITLLPDR